MEMYSCKDCSARLDNTDGRWMCTYCGKSERSLTADGTMAWSYESKFEVGMPAMVSVVMEASTAIRLGLLVPSPQRY